VTDEELIGAARAGDQASFGALVEKHRRDALRVAYAIADGEAEDVTQDAFVKAYRNLARFESSRSFKPWLLAIVTNEAKNRRRSFARRSALVLRVRPLADTVEHVESEVVAHERREALVAAMAKLPDRDREVIGLRYFAQLSEADMATAMQCAAGTVKSRLARALERLRRELGEIDT
jgi:RNA polymerase sigma factor (sigma-70 family)